MATAVLVFTPIPKYKYILSNFIFCVAMFVSTPSAQICAQVLLINAASGPRVKKRKTATEFSCYRIREGARYVNDEVISPPSGGQR